MKISPYDLTAIFNFIIISINIFITIRSTLYITKKEKDLVNIEFQLDKARLKLEHLEKVVSEIKLISEPEIKYTFHYHLNLYLVDRSNSHKTSYEKYIKLFNNNYYLLNNNTIKTLKDFINNNQKKITKIENIINDPLSNIEADIFSESEYYAETYMFMQESSKKIKDAFLEEFSKTLNTMFE